MPFADREIKRAYDRGWAAGRRALFFEDKTCAVCGGAEQLQLHHFASEEKIANAIWSWGREKRQREIAKCVVVCSDCHARVHRPERQAAATHRNRTFPRDERGRLAGAA